MDDWDLPPLTFTEGMNVGILERISEPRVRSGGQTNKILTQELDKLKTQAMAVNKDITRYKLNVVKTWQEPGSASKRPPAQRPVLQEIIRWAKEARIQVLLVYSPDRIDRWKPWHGMFIIEELNSNTCQVYSHVYGWLDLRTAFRAHMVYTLLFLACMESHNTSLRVRQRRAREIAEAIKEERVPKLGGWPKIELTKEQEDKIREYGITYSINDIIGLMANEGVTVTEWVVKRVLNRVK